MLCVFCVVCQKIGVKRCKNWKEIIDMRRKVLEQDKMVKTVKAKSNLGEGIPNNKPRMEKFLKTEPMV